MRRLLRRAALHAQIVERVLDKARLHLRRLLEETAGSDQKLTGASCSLTPEKGRKEK